MFWKSPRLCHNMKEALEYRARELPLWGRKLLSGRADRLCGQGRNPKVPLVCRLVSVTDAQRQGLGISSADDLQRRR